MLHILLDYYFMLDNNFMLDIPLVSHYMHYFHNIMHLLYYNLNFMPHSIFMLHMMLDTI
jgi:hypothetical protein